MCGRRRRRESDQRIASSALATPAAGGLPDFGNNCSGWYRKHFSLPATWEGGVTWVYFEGVHHYSYVWLNGKPLGRHINGYLSFWYRLDTNGVKFGAGNANRNVLAVYANSDPGSGMYGYSQSQMIIPLPLFFKMALNPRFRCRFLHMGSSTGTGYWVQKHVSNPN